MSGYTPKHTDAQYLLFDPFSGDRDVDIQFQKWAIVTTRTGHRCAAGDMNRAPHEIAPGTRCWRESGKVEGKVGSCWCCFRCLDAMTEPNGFCWVCGEDHAPVVKGARP